MSEMSEIACINRCWEALPLNLATSLPMENCSCPQGGSVDDDRQDSQDTRSAMAKALDLVTQISTISLMAVLPAVGGYFVDRWLETKIVLLLVGLALGMAVAALQLMKLVKKLEQATAKKSKKI